ELVAHGRRLSRGGGTRPQRIVRREIRVAGGPPLDEVEVLEQAALGLPQVAVDRLLARARHVRPALGVGRLAELPREVGEIELVAVEETIQTDAGVVMGRATEWAEMKVDVETRFTHRSVAVIVIGAEAIAIDPRRRAHL